MFVFAEAPVTSSDSFLGVYVYVSLHGSVYVEWELAPVSSLQLGYCAWHPIPLEYLIQLDNNATALMRTNETWALLPSLANLDWNAEHTVRVHITCGAFNESMLIASNVARELRSYTIPTELTPPPPHITSSSVNTSGLLSAITFSWVMPRFNAQLWNITLASYTWTTLQV